MYEETIKELRDYASTRKGEIAELTRGAADAIEGLQEERNVWKATAEDWRDAYHHWFEIYQKDVPKWIPVTERLPECEWGTEVGNIEWISYGKVFAGCFGRGGKYRDAYFRTWTDGTEGIDAKDADYWRQIQIPEPPKEEIE